MQLAIEFCIYEKYVRANALKTVHIILHGYGREAAECFLHYAVNGLKLIFR